MPNHRPGSVAALLAAALSACAGASTSARAQSVPPTSELVRPGERHFANVRQLTSGGHHTQPRWSPKGDVIVFTTRQGTHDLWAIAPDGSNPRRLTAGPGDNQGATWAPNGRHLAFQSNRLGSWQIFAMLADGSEQTSITRGTTDHTSPSWSSRLP